MNRHLKRSALIFTAAAFSVAASAQSYRVEQQSGDVFSMPEPVLAPKAGVRAPVNGMTKAVVKKRFGTPERQEGAVGDPPISVWYYPEFEVFFEYNLVLHSVVKSDSPTVYYPE